MKNSIKFIYLFLILSISITACKKKDWYWDKDVECNNSEKDGYRTITESSVTREYILYTPSSYDANNLTPLIINFHGFGDCIDSYSENIGNLNGFNASADANNFLVAYPQGAFRDKGSNYWEPGDNGNQDIGENDVYFTKQLIKDIAKDYNVDLNRVYAVGYSNGGMMSYDLACTGSNFIAAVGIMSGTMLLDACDNTSEYTSAIHFHGTNDDVLPLNGNNDFKSISEVINFWLNHNNISASSKVTSELNGTDVIRDEYSGGNGNTDITLYTIRKEFGKEGGHVWFTNEINGKHPNEILWDFLSSYRLDD